MVKTRRRDKKSRSDGYYTKERARINFIRNQLINSKGAVCGICGKPITCRKDCTVDHIVPLAKGGATMIENCQLAHFDCNQKKGSR